MIAKTRRQYRAIFAPRRQRFTTCSRCYEIYSLDKLPSRTVPTYHETTGNDLLALRWTTPPRNILLVQKDQAPKATESLLEFAKYIQSTYPAISIILEARTAAELHTCLPFPVYSPAPVCSTTQDSVHGSSELATKIDLTTTFGGDGTILRASSFFSDCASVPPILSFSLGTLGFLSEWKFAEYKRAFREVYMSGYTAVPGERCASPSAWPTGLGAFQGTRREARVLLRNRLRVALPHADEPLQSNSSPRHALNEILLHRGRSPHLAHIAISLNGKPLTTAIADGLIISTPTGSTAYSLSAGGSIVHPLVKSIVLTPVCARSLSFRPLMLPESAVVELVVAKGTRQAHAGLQYHALDQSFSSTTLAEPSRVDVSVDGVDVPGGLAVGQKVRIWSEGVGRVPDRRASTNTSGHDVPSSGWTGGIPCIMRHDDGPHSGDDGWVGGLNGLLKFNYPFGEEEPE